ncbi:MAG: PHB depolymerase family esterase [Burkholderiaceae bacterium]|nr:PHB depolymerase family esterase [Burkholderiaceae bacterium]
MARRSPALAWASHWQRALTSLTRSALAAGAQAVSTGKRATTRSLRSAVSVRAPPKGAGDWIAGAAMGPGGARRYRLFRPPGVSSSERLPLLVMLHGCGQDANRFATSTRMNRIALRERFLVLYPEQDRLANAQGCWNWFETASGRAYGEAALIMAAIDQVCLLYPVDPLRIAVAGLSAGASMAALLVTRSPGRFKALAMHSGVPPGTARSGLSAVGAMHGRRATAPLNANPATMAASWPPLLVIHGEADHVVSAHNGRLAVDAWAQAADAVAGKPRRIQRGQRHPMTITEYRHDGITVATLIEVNRLGHAWSGGAPSQPYGDAHGPDASRLIWAFARRQLGV